MNIGFESDALQYARGLLGLGVGLPNKDPDTTAGDDSEKAKEETQKWEESFSKRTKPNPSDRLRDSEDLQDLSGLPPPAPTPSQLHTEESPVFSRYHQAPLFSPLSPLNGSLLLSGPTQSPSDLVLLLLSPISESSRDLPDGTYQLGPSNDGLPSPSIVFASFTASPQLVNFLPLLPQLLVNSSALPVPAVSAVSSSASASAPKCTVHDPSATSADASSYSVVEVDLPDFNSIINFRHFLKKRKDVCVQCGSSTCATPAAPPTATELIRPTLAQTLSKNWEAFSSAAEGGGSKAGELLKVTGLEGGAVIPSQNKGVCTVCDVAIWECTLDVSDAEGKATKMQVLFKWCKVRSHQPLIPYLSPPHNHSPPRLLPLRRVARTSSTCRSLATRRTLQSAPRAGAGRRHNTRRKSRDRAGGVVSNLMNELTT